MADQTAKGEDFERKAEKKLACWGIFGSKYYDAADLFDKAASCFKLGENWDKAGSVYIKLANIHLKLDRKHVAAQAYLDASNCYKKISILGILGIPDAAQSLNHAFHIFLEIGRFYMAARCCKELGEIHEVYKDLAKAIEYFERAADLFQSEKVTISANQCKQKVAQLAAQLEQYPKAIDIYEAIAQHLINNSPFKYGVKGILLNAGICQLCKADDVAITNALERYQEIDPTFSSTREYKFLSGLVEAIVEGDIAKYTDSCVEYDSFAQLDPWKRELLYKVEFLIRARKAKPSLKRKAEDEDVSELKKKEKKKIKVEKKSNGAENGQKISNISSNVAQTINQAVYLFLKIGRLNTAARYCKELGEIYEQQQNLDQAIEYFELAADLFEDEEVTTANQCKQKVAQFAAHLEQYPKAIQIYEVIAQHSINNTLLKYGVKGILLDAGICQLCKADVVAITNALERYQEIDPTFSDTREYKFLSELAEAMNEGDIAKHTDACVEYGTMTQLDPWQTTLLLRVKNAISRVKNAIKVKPMRRVKNAIKVKEEEKECVE